MPGAGQETDRDHTRECLRLGSWRVQSTTQAIAFILASAIMCSTPCLSLTQEELDRATRKGLKARKVLKVPQFLYLGMGSRYGLGRSIMRGRDPQGYGFLIKTCKTWVANQAYHSKTTEEGLDTEAINERCLGSDMVQVAVVAADAVPRLEHYDSKFYPTPEEPITKLFLRAGKKILLPLSMGHFDDLGKGNATAYFDYDEVRAAKNVKIVAELGREYMLVYEVQRWARSQLFPKRK